MKSSSGDTLLIGAVLERLGNAHAQALLEQIHKGLPQHDRAPHKESRKTERRRGGIGNHNFE
jgi:hypothetical protein